MDKFNLAKLKSDIEDCLINLIDDGYDVHYSYDTNVVRVELDRNAYGDYLANEAFDEMRKFIEYIKDDYNIQSNISFKYVTNHYKFCTMLIKDFLNNKFPDEWDNIRGTCISMVIYIYKF